MVTRYISAENQAALEANRLVPRDFVWFVARNRSTGEPVYEGLWSDIGGVTASVIDPTTGLEDERNWFGSGNLVAISDIPAVSNLTIQTVEIQLSQILDRINQLVRDYDLMQARVEIYRGWFDPTTRIMVAPAEARFVGFVDHVEILTPSENSEGGVTLTCKSHTQELTRANTDTRSNASQNVRQSGDTFYKDSATVSDWEVFWGSEKGKMPTQPKRKKFLGIF